MTGMYRVHRFCENLLAMDHLTNTKLQGPIMSVAVGGRIEYKIKVIRLLGLLGLLGYSGY